MFDRMCGSRKYPYPNDRGSLEIPRGRRGSKGKDEPKLEFPEGWGVQTQNKTSVGWGGGEYGYFLEQHNLTCHV